MPAEADFNLLDTARKVEVYGIRMHQAKVHIGWHVKLHFLQKSSVAFHKHRVMNFSNLAGRKPHSMLMVHS